MADEKNNAEVWQRDEIQSPCVNICLVHPETRLCTGCGRSMDEIRDWSAMGDAARAAITAVLPERMKTLPKRRGGRAARLKRG